MIQGKSYFYLNANEQNPTQYSLIEQLKIPYWVDVDFTEILISTKKKENEHF
jgi:hypothetical protein